MTTDITRMEPRVFKRAALLDEMAQRTFKLDPRYSHSKVKVSKEKWDLFYNKGCWYCGAKAKAWDHMVPRSKGGLDDESNLTPACTPCNAAKRDRTVEEFRRLMAINKLCGSDGPLYRNHPQYKLPLRKILSIVHLVELKGGPADHHVRGLRELIDEATKSFKFAGEL